MFRFDKFVSFSSFKYLHGFDFGKITLQIIFTWELRRLWLLETRSSRATSFASTSATFVVWAYLLSQLYYKVITGQLCQGFFSWLGQNIRRNFAFHLTANPNHLKQINLHLY